MLRILQYFFTVLVIVYLMESHAATIHDTSCFSSLSFPRLSDFVMLERLDKDNKIIHIEYYQPRWFHPIASTILKKAPKYLRKLYKPVAKTGIRTYSSSGSYMDSLLSSIFSKGDIASANSVEDFTVDDLPDNNSPSLTSRPHKSIGLFIYMHVLEEYRGYNLGDQLLHVAMERCRLRGDEFMLLTHDDNGSGKLVEYYKTRGFVPIFDFINNGMICRL